jgi:hypothetical protein
MATSQTSKLKFCIALILMTGCFSRSTYLTRETYDNIQISTPMASLEDQVGKPYAIHKKCDGTQEYEYIERIDMGNHLVVENHYFIIVQNGQVVGKYMTQEKAPAYNLIYQEDPNYIP